MGVHKGIFALVLLFFVWLTMKILFPFLFPFLLGLGIALAAEPMVNAAQTRLRFPRGWSAGVGVSVTLILLLGLIFFLGAIIVRELGLFVQQIPAVAKQSAGLLEDALVSLSSKAPAPVGPVLTNSIHNIFQDSTVLADQAVQKMPELLSGFLGKLPSSAMILGTGVLSGYFISARLPKLKAKAANALPSAWKEQILPTLQHLKGSLGKWLLAQGKLMSITYGIVSIGLLLLGIPYAFAWAILVAVVDAIPLLGTGIILLPWALTKLLQGEPVTAAGMAAIYLVAVVTRSVLEPRFFGRHLGLDPLVMLIFLFFGYRLWGFLGIILSPLLAATTKVLTEQIDN